MTSTLNSPNNDSINIRAKYHNKSENKHVFTFPSKEEVQQELLNTVLTDDMSMYKNKIYIDERYHSYAPEFVCSNLHLMGDWSYQQYEYDGQPVIRYIDNKSGQYFEITLQDHTERIKLMNEVSFYGKLQEMVKDYTVDRLVYYREQTTETTNAVKNVIKATGLIVGTALLVPIFKFFSTKRLKTK